jgi:trk system potassium uptake protein TrkH
MKNAQKITIWLLPLIVIGGHGFFVWDDITEHKLHVTKYHLHSKVMLTGTLFLIVVGALLFCLFEAAGTSPLVA